ncbi:MAG TPA: hypothetical protein VND80_08460 [Steroidobacteraceae bacterium]|nr:hypothetical protein [Steroidobacteraceae bacterium]
MNRIVQGIFLLAAAPAVWGASCARGTNYGQTLLENLVHTNPAVLAAAMHVTPPKGRAPLVAASTNSRRIGTRSGAAELAVIANGKPIETVDAAKHRVDVLLPLEDVSRDKIGALRLSLRLPAGADRASILREAVGIRDALRRRIALAANVYDPVPYDPTMPSATDTYAQKLVDGVLARHPGVLIFAIHATPPGGDYNVIIGSNIGRIGKKADNDDTRAIYTGNTNLEVNEAGDRFEVEMQLRDRAGRVIGAVSVVYPYRKGADQKALEARAVKIKDALQRRIPDAASLFQPAH